MEAYILRTIKKIRKDAPRRLKELRTVCDELIDILSAKSPESLSEDGNADKYFSILEAACESKNARLMEIGLDAIHGLIEHGYLRGASRMAVQGAEGQSGDGERRTLMDHIIDVVTRCSEEYDETVHLQVMKVLLMALTSQHCQVHESSLLQAVRACFQIHLITKSQVNKTTAKAALTQMLSIVFQRMEAFDARAKAETEAALAAMGAEHEEEAQIDAKDAIKSIPPSAAGQCMYSSVFATLGFAAGGPEPLPSNDFASNEASSATHSFASILHKDAFLLFRALCKLSMKGINDDSATQQDPVALQNKILSLELILHILQRSGPAFRSGEKFVYAIKQYLCVSLLGNCTSPIAQVTTLSLHIFVSLLNGFKDHLKSELEIFVGSIFLKILESENSTFEHKCRVLEVLQNFCLDPAAQIELFINYDCDFEGNDLFRRIVDAFSKIAKNPILPRSAVDFMSSKKTLQEEHTIRFMALEGLVIVLKSMLRSTSFGIQGENSLGGVLARATSNLDEVPPDDDAGQGNFPFDESVSVSGAAPSIFNGTKDGSSTDVSGKHTEPVLPVSGGGGLVQNYDRKHKTQSEIETGIIKFNLSPKKGLAYLASLGHLKMTPRDVALFLRDYQDKLDKTAVGEYLGKEPEYEGGFCIRVLHEYVDSMDFADMHFDEAIRLFLSGFRIPGESQKIDRMMEKFAERYYLQNRNVFMSADMAFILAFSTIMLQTNLHNPAIRDDKRMTKDQFLKQNKGISSDGELSDEMLMDIYDRIAATPISLAQDDKEKKRLARKEEAPSVFAFSADKKRKDAYNDERKEIVKMGEALFKQNMRTKRTTSVFVRAAQYDEAYIAPMFEAAWPSMVSTFSQNFETSDDEDIVALCLEGFQFSIRLAARLDVSISRETFINALSRFSTLDSIKEMKKKNVRAIQALIRIALAEGDFMFESWGQLLKIFSQLARLYAIGSGAVSDEVHDGRGASSRGRKNRQASVAMQMVGTADQISRFFVAPSKADANKQIEEANAVLIQEEIDPSLLDRIYLNSKSLSSESVQHFVRHLCAVSLIEISPGSMGDHKAKLDEPPTPPRVFSLQKIVEVADCNMNCRPRLAWTSMWSVLAMHFTTVGIHENHALAMYAIDSLKQLSIKFLQKVELTNFNFQRLFLKPFEIMMSRSKSNEIKELILSCLDIMIKSCAHNIRSGWRSIFAVFSVAAGSDSREIAAMAFDITERLTTQQFDLLIYDFVELMNCLVSFIAGPHTNLSLAALSHLSGCADHLAVGDVQPALETQPLMQDSSGSIASPKATEYGHEVAVEDSASQVFRLWWPLLLGLSTRVSDARVEVRNRALQMLHKVLSKHGNLFSTQTWEVVFRGVLFPVVDSAKTDETPQAQSAWPTQKPSSSKDAESWIATTAGDALGVIVKLYHQFRPSRQTDGLLTDTLSILESCINQDIETLSLLGLKALSDFVLSFDDSSEYPMEPATRTVICDHLCDSMLKNLCLDFGDCGVLELDQAAGGEVRRALLDCPVARRRRFRSSESEIGTEIQTPYGIGKVINILVPDDNIGVSSRRTIKLSFGVLYSRDKFRSAASVAPSEETRGGDGRPSASQLWSSVGASAMTSMVVMLEYIKVLSRIINDQYNSWTLDHFSKMIRCLEASYHHARCFNSDEGLRTRLWNKGFMRFKNSPEMLPHLVEQETSSLVHILVVAFRLYLRDGGSHPEAAARSSFAEPIVMRICSMAYRSYVELEELTNSEELSNRFLIETKAKHQPGIIILLSSLLQVTEEQFKRNVGWVAPMLSALSICDDKDVRRGVQRVYQSHLNPLVIALCKPSC